MSIARIGPIETDIFDPEFVWRSEPDTSGRRRATIGGLVEWTPAHQLSELVANGWRRVGYGGSAGVLVHVYADDALLRGFTGWYLLTTCDLDTPQEASVTGLVGFSIDATFLGPREPIVTHTARPRDNDYSLAARSAVALPWAGEFDAAPQPLYAPGGDRLERESEDGRVAVYLGDLTDATDELPAVIPLALPAGVTEWITDTTADVRAYDRREDRAVYGPHPFKVPTDLRLENGLLRVWVGPRGFPAHLQLQAWTDGAWEQLGNLAVALSNNLIGARLVRLTPDEGVIGLVVQGVGEILVTLRRGERLIRLSYGRTVGTDSIRARWLGIPPFDVADELTTAAGTFNDGLTLTVGEHRIAWPLQVNKTAWTLTVRWKPDDDAGTQADSGIATIWDSTGVAGQVEYLTTGDKIRWTQGANIVESAALSFNAGDDLLVGLSFSSVDGMQLTVDTTTNSNPAGTDPGTTDDSFTAIDIGLTSTGDAGDGDAGDGIAGSVQYAGGVIDNLQLFEDALTATEAAALAGATDGTDGLPTPEGRLVLHIHYDARPLPLGSSFTSGRRYETTIAGGTIRNPDSLGYTRAIAVLDNGATVLGDGLAVTTEDELAAYLATTETNDDLADLHAQYAAANTNQVRVR